MKKFVLTISLLGNATLLYLLYEDKKKLYDAEERASFYKEKYEETAKLEKQ